MKKIKQILNSGVNLLYDIDKLSLVTLTITCMYLLIKYTVALTYSIYNNSWLCLDTYLVICILLNGYVIFLRARNKEISFKSVDIVFLVLNFMYFLSAISNRNVFSFWGKIGRYEGLMTLILYACIYFVCRTIKKKKYINKLIKLVLYVGVINALTGMVQSYTDIGTFSSFDNMAYGLMDNPNIFGLYMVMLFPLALILYLSKKEKKYLICSILYYISILLSDSSASFATMCIALLAILIYYIKNKLNIKPLLKLYLIFLLIFPVVSYSASYVNYALRGKDMDTSIVTDMKTVANDYTSIEIDPEETTDDVTSGRLGLWKIVIEKGKDHLLFGHGPDNMYIFRTRDEYIYFDKAHNHYLEVYYASGIIAALLYIAFIGLVFLRSDKKDYLSLALLLGFISYSIDIFASISAPFAAIYYYIVIGLLMTLKDNILKTKRR